MVERDKKKKYYKCEKRHHFQKVVDLNNYSYPISIFHGKSLNVYSFDKVFEKKTS